jgi:hypothetical protein
MLRSFIAGLAAFALAGIFDSAAHAQAIKIAILGPMAFVQGENHWAGAEMARDEINKAGGVNVGGKPRQIELIRADTNEIQSVPDATNAVERVITRDRADFLIGGFRHRCSSRSLRISPLHLEFHLPLPHSSQVVSSAIPKLSPGISHSTCSATCAHFTPSNSD